MYGDKIRELRENLNMTQEEFAKAINISRSALSNYERSFRQPEYDVLKKIAKFCNVTTDYILELDIKPTTEQKSIIDAIKTLNVEETHKVIEMTKLLFPNKF